MAAAERAPERDPRPPPSLTIRQACTQHARADTPRFRTGSSPRGRGWAGWSDAMRAPAFYAGAMADHLVPPYGGALVDGVVDDERASELRKASTYWPSCDLTP